MKSRNIALKFGAGAALLAMAFNASAVVVLDAAITDGLTSVLEHFNALLTAVYPIMIAIATGLIIFGMVKMFIHKAAGR